MATKISNASSGCFESEDLRCVDKGREKSLYPYIGAAFRGKCAVM